MTQFTQSRKMISFNKYYLLAALFLLIAEIIIAAFITDKFVRPYLGDVLVVILIYSLLKSFFNLPPTLLATGVLLFSFFIEWLQYIKLLKILNLDGSSIAITVAGNSFSWKDILAYTAGIAMVLVIEKYMGKKLQNGY